MVLKRRKTKRIQTYKDDSVPKQPITAEVTQVDSKIYCVIKDISVDGVCLLIDKEQDFDLEIFTVHINPIEEIHFEGLIIKVKKKWLDDQLTLLHKSVGCEFIKDSEEAEEVLSELNEKLKKNHTPNMFILGDIENV